MPERQSADAPRRDVPHNSHRPLQDPHEPVLSARHAGHLVADAALFAGELPDQQQRAPDLHRPQHFGRHRAHCGAGGPLEPVRVLFRAAWAGLCPPGRGVQAASPVPGKLCRHPPRRFSEELAHPLLLRRSHPLYGCFRHLQLYHPVGCARIHHGRHPGKTDLSVAVQCHLPCRCAAHGLFCAGTAVVHLGAQKFRHRRQGELRLRQAAVFPGIGRAGPLELRGAAPHGSVVCAGHDADVRHRGGGGAGEHPRHAPALPRAAIGGAALLRLPAGLQGNGGPVHHPRSALLPDPERRCLCAGRAPRRQAQPPPRAAAADGHGRGRHPRHLRHYSLPAQSAAGRCAAGRRGRRDPAGHLPPRRLLHCPRKYDARLPLGHPEKGRPHRIGRPDDQRRRGRCDPRHQFKALHRQKCKGLRPDICRDRAVGRGQLVQHPLRRDADSLLRRGIAALPREDRPERGDQAQCRYPDAGSRDRPPSAGVRLRQLQLRHHLPEL